MRVQKALPKRYVITQAKVYWLTVLAFLASILLAYVLDSWDDEVLREESREELHQELLEIEGALQYRLRRRVELTAGLASYIQSQPDLTQKEFAQVAGSISKLSQGLAGIQLERDDHISHVYPEGEFEDITGKRLSDLYREDEQGELSPISPPMPRRDPPGILAYRVPIKITLNKDNGSESEDVWGYVIYLIDVEEIIESTGMLGENAAIDLALTFTPDQGQEKIIFGDPSVLQRDPVFVQLGLPGGDWELAGIDPGWQAIIRKHHTHRRLVLALAILFFTLWSFSLLSRLRSRGLVSDVEAARQESERQFAYLIREASVDPIGIYDQQGRIIEFNEEATRALGYSREELHQLTVYDIDCELGHARIEEGLRNLKPGMISVLRTRHRRKDGTEFPVELRLGVVETGEGLRVICAVRDITAQKRYEEELENINRDKDKFFSIIAHDLKGPLAGFLGLAEMLAQDSESFSKEDLKVLGAEMHKAGQNLFNLLEDLLDWSRLQMGRIDLTPQAFAMTHVIEANVSLLGVNARSKQIELLTDYSGDTQVVADLDMINTVVRNLVSNAVKFTPQGGRVNIRASRVDKGVQVAVEDTGVGMSEEQIANLFRPGQAKRTEGTAHEKGTGLGLLLCHELLKRNNSDLTVTSELGKGSTFAFTLPAADENDPVVPNSALSAVTGTPFKKSD